VIASFFREYLSKHSVRYTEPEMGRRASTGSSGKIKQEVFMSAFNQPGKASRFCWKPDPQVQKAVEAISAGTGTCIRTPKKIVAQARRGRVDRANHKL